MTLHIRSAEVENFKRIKEVEISEMGDVVTIGGRNAQGKSSFIDAIWNTLGGKQRAVTKPVRDGESKASSTITIEDTAGGGLVVTRTWKENGTSQLTVKPLGSAAKLDKPQDVLNDLIGAFAFDPMAYLQLTEAKQREVLADLIGLDLSQLDEAEKSAYAQRTEANREVERLQGSLDTLERPAADLPDEFVSVTALIEERQNLERTQRGRQERYDRLQSIAAEIARLEEERARLEGEVNKADAWLNDRRAVAEVDADIANAETTNQAIHAAQTYRERKGELRAAEKLHSELDTLVKAAREAKREALAKASLPLPGLSFDENGVLYNGEPLAQASAAEQRRVSMSIAMALNPELKVICLKDASLIDDEGQAQIRALAAENDFQLILELVGSTGNETIVIEDGEVA